MRYMINRKNNIYIPDIGLFITLANTGLTRRKLETNHSYFNYLKEKLEKQIHHEDLKHSGA